MTSLISELDSVAPQQPHTATNELHFSLSLSHATTTTTTTTTTIAAAAAAADIGEMTFVPKVTSFLKPEVFVRPEFVGLDTDQVSFRTESAFSDEIPPITIDTCFDPSTANSSPTSTLIFTPAVEALTLRNFQDNTSTTTATSSSSPENSPRITNSPAIHLPDVTHNYGSDNTNSNNYYSSNYCSSNNNNKSLLTDNTNTTVLTIDTTSAINHSNANTSSSSTTKTTTNNNSPITTTKEFDQPSPRTPTTEDRHPNITTTTTTTTITITSKDKVLKTRTDDHHSSILTHSTATTTTTNSSSPETQQRADTFDTTDMSSSNPSPRDMLQLTLSIPNATNSTSQRVGEREGGGQGQSRNATNSAPQYDRFGFLVTEEDQLKTAIFLDNPKLVRKENERLIKWQKMLTHFEKYTTVKADKLSRRAWKGLPDAVRGDVWLKLSGRVRESSIPHDIKSLVTQSIHPDWKEQIMKDVPRTFSSNEYFTKFDPLTGNLVPNETGHQNLYDVLHSYAVLDPEVNYCQGMNFLASVPLFYMNVDDAFQAFVYLMQGIGFREYFLLGFPRLQRSILILDQLMAKHLAKLHKHLKKECVIINSVVMQWFLTMFTYNLPFPAVVRVWDWLFIEGHDVVFAVALAVFKLVQGNMLKLKETELIEYINSFSGKLKLTPENLIEIALEFKGVIKTVEKLKLQDPGTYCMSRQEIDLYASSMRYDKQIPFYLRNKQLSTTQQQQQQQTPMKKPKEGAYS